MKVRFIPFLFCIVLSGIVTSCKDKPNELPEGRVTSLYQDKLEEDGDDVIYAWINEGYYEVDDLEARQALMKLQAAGLITYKVERFAWYNKIEESKSVLDHYKSDYYYDDYFGYSYYLGERPVYKTVHTTDYNLEEHYLVTVALTEEGKKQAMDSIPEVKEKEDKLLAIPNINYKDFPEENISLEEKFPEIPYPGPKKPAEKAPTNDAKDKPTKAEETIADYPYTMDKKTTEAYLKAKKKIKATPKYFKAFNIKATDARNIRIASGQNGTFAEADVIVKVKKTTPIGRILCGAYNGIPSENHVSLEYFADKGWSIRDKKLDINLDGIKRAKEIRYKDEKKNEETADSVLVAEEEEENDVVYDSAGDTCAVDTVCAA